MHRPSCPSVAAAADGRGGRIRTSDPLLPKQMRYQTALRPAAQPPERLLATMIGSIDRPSAKRGPTA